MGLVPGVGRVCSLFRKLCPVTYTREAAGKMTLGAYNCFRYEHRAGASLAEACVNRTHFLEDIECTEMHQYVDQVQGAIRVGDDTAHPSAWTPSP